MPLTASDHRTRTQSSPQEVHPQTQLSLHCPHRAVPRPPPPPPFTAPAAPPKPDALPPPSALHSAPSTTPASPAPPFPSAPASPTSHSSPPPPPQGSQQPIPITTIAAHSSPQPSNSPPSPSKAIPSPHSSPILLPRLSRVCPESAHDKSVNPGIMPRGSARSPAAASLLRHHAGGFRPTSRRKPRPVRPA